MAKFARFSEILKSLEGPVYRDIFISARHVRVVIAAGDGGALIQLEGQEILVREDAGTVISALS
jgi:hypothetical protein